MSQRRNEIAEKAVMVMATAWVVLCGAATSVFLVVSGSSTPTQTLLTLAGGAVGVAFLLWLVRDRNPLTPRGSIFAWFRRKRPEVIAYQFKRRRNRMSNDPPPQPPTAEHVRELAKEGLNTWVPSQGSRDKRGPR